MVVFSDIAVGYVTLCFVVFCTSGLILQ